MKKNWELYKSFFRIGILTFGGGYAMLPMMTREIVEHHNWASEDDLLDYYAIGQCTPGVIAVNTATFVGRKVNGIPGALCATLGVITPSFVIISLIAALLYPFMGNPYVAHALAGLRIMVCALILNSVYKMAKRALVDLFTVFICIGALILAFVPVVPTYVIVLLAAAAGIIYQLRKGGRTS